MAATVVVIGMRGAGKTTISAQAADCLGFAFTDLDELITRTSGGKLPPQLVQEHGWEGFRRLELEALELALGAGGGRPGIVACGGGVVETDAALARLEQHWPVVMIDRHIDDIADYLEKRAGAAAPQRAGLGEPVRVTYERRLPRYLRCLDFRLPVARGPQSVDHLGLQLARMVSQALGQRSVYLGPDTFLMSLTLPNYDDAGASLLRSLAQGGDMLEFRVDLLESWSPEYVAQQLAVLRNAACGAPVLFTVRTLEHGGAFNGSEDEYFQLVHLGHQLGADMLDVECTWSPEKIQRVVSLRGRAAIVGSFHDFHRMPPREELRRRFDQCSLGGAAAVAKVVVKPQHRDDNFLVQEVGAAASAEAGCAFIGLCLGELGKLSRVLNRVLTPTTHKDLVAAAPGQMLLEEMVACRRSMAMLAPPQQYLFYGVGEQLVSTLLSAFPLTAALTTAFGELTTPSGDHGCAAGPFCSVQLGNRSEEVRRLCALSSVGGVAIGGAEVQLALAAELPSLGVGAKAACAVDTIAVKDGVPMGDCCLAAALHALVGTGIGGSGRTTAAQPSACVATGTAADARVAAGALSAAGFRIPRSAGGKPGPRAAPSCWDGCLQLLASQAPARRPKAPEGGVSPSLLTEAGLTYWASSLAAMPGLDVFLLVEPSWEEPGTGAAPSSPAWQELLQALRRHAPVVVDAGPVPAAGGRRVALLEAAQASGCRTVEAPELLVELACQRLTCWTGAGGGPRSSLAARLLQEVPAGSMTAAGRARLEREAAGTSSARPQ